MTHLIRTLSVCVCFLVSVLLSNLENREHPKIFRNVDYVPSWAQNHKLITVAVCSFVISRPIGLFLSTQ